MTSTFLPAPIGIMKPSIIIEICSNPIKCFQSCCHLDVIWVIEN